MQLAPYVRATIADTFFCPALETVSTMMRLSPDVAGRGSHSSASRLNLTGSVSLKPSEVTQRFPQKVLT